MDKKDLPQPIQAFLKESGFKKLTAVQQKVFKEYEKGQSLLALAPTASGKTLSFAIPLVLKLKENELVYDRNKDANTPFALVLTPTRELASQVFGVFKSLAHHAKFKARFISGGNSKLAARKNEIFDILVATPQTALSLIKLKKLSLKKISYLVIDEADQVLDPGFKKEIKGITNRLDFSETHLGLFSATYPPMLSEWTREYFKDVSLKELLIKGNLKQGTLIKTFNIHTKPTQRLVTLKTFLQKTLDGKGIIFCSQKNQVALIQDFLKEEFPKLKSTYLHGDLSGTERKKNLKKFTDLKTQVLVASDISARGMDIKKLDWVFNYTLPRTAIYYLHRVGRLSRDGRPGTVYNLVAGADDKIIALINEAIQREGHLALKKLPYIKDLSRTRKKAKKKPKRKITKRTRR